MLGMNSYCLQNDVIGLLHSFQTMINCMRHLGSLSSTSRCFWALHPPALGYTLRSNYRLQGNEDYPPTDLAL